MKVRFYYINIIAGIFILLTGSIGFAGDKNRDEERAREIEKYLFMASGAQNRVLRIGLVDCISWTLKNNSDVLIKLIEPKIKDADIRIAKAGFEPLFNADWTIHSNSEESTSTIGYSGVSKTKDTGLNMGVSGKIVSGTEYSFDILTDKYKSNVSTQRINPYYTIEPKITITQPVFKNFGKEVNTADIVIAMNDKEESWETFRETVAASVTDTKIAFYNYIYYIENYSIKVSSLVKAKDLLKINKMRYRKGLVSSVDLLEIETYVSQKQKAVIVAEADLKKSEDSLKAITNLVKDPEVWNARIELIDKNLEFDEKKIDLINSLKNAFSYRPDYIADKIALRNKDIKIITAENLLYPEVDIVGSFGLNGLGEDYMDAVQGINDSYRDWSIGLKVEIPWGNTENTAKLDQRKLESAKAILEFKKLEYNIILDVRGKVRALDVAKRQVITNKIYAGKEARNYKAQLERYAEGQISTHDMLDYQEELAQSELDYLKSLVDYNIAVVTLDKSEGLTLVRNNITVMEE
jgi:outer membrane protein